jgi:hypothetical protein
MTDSHRDPSHPRRQPARGPRRDDPGQDRISLIVRSPDSVYVYWMLRGEQSRQVVEELGPGCEWVLRVLDLSEGTSRRLSVRPEAGGFYVEVRPGGTYGFELAAWSEGKWRTVCRSDRTTMPPAPTPVGAADRTGPGKLRARSVEAAAPGLRLETTLPFLASSPRGKAEPTTH